LRRAVVLAGILACAAAAAQGPWEHAADNGDVTAADLRKGLALSVTPDGSGPLRLKPKA